jgi:hypothetical protein
MWGRHATDMNFSNTLNIAKFCVESWALLQDSGDSFFELYHQVLVDKTLEHGPGRIKHPGHWSLQAGQPGVPPWSQVLP